MLRTDDATTLGEAEVEAILTQGSLELEGRIASASNASFLAHASLDGVSLSCIYKPVQGERPLWDFPDGTLAGRERAARLVSQAGGWCVVPPTVLREGRFGPGMCQQWIEVDPGRDHVDVVSIKFQEPGWIPVLQAEDQLERPVLLVHRDDAQLRDMSVFDVVANNADRKGGHVLPDPAGGLWGCDHGVCFHSEVKLRTVLWGWADEPLRDADVLRLEQLAAALNAGTDDALAPLITDIELAALHGRVDALLAAGVMPTPHGRWPPIPWPAF